MPLLCDVVVVGGGPAGSAAALALQARGIGALVVERGAYDEPRCGETLHADARHALIALGAWQSFMSLRPVPAPRLLSAWGEARPRERPAELERGGHGWHIDRVSFDAMLARAAERAGALVYCGVTAVAVTRAGTRWRVSLRGSKARTEVDARWLVDASGRSSFVARHAGARRASFDRLVGVVGRYDAPLDDGRLLVESVEDGWWYSTPVPGGKTVAVYLSDSDTLAGRDLRMQYQDRLGAAPQTSARLGHLQGPELRVVAAATQSISPAAGESWIAAGDAAFTLDPLSGSGIRRALDGGLAAGIAIAAALHGDNTAVDRVRRGLEAEVGRELAARRDHYAQEQRWPASPFWARRQSLKESPGFAHRSRT